MNVFRGLGNVLLAVLFAAALILTAAYSPGVASEKDPASHNFAFSLISPTGEVSQLAELTVFGQMSWSCSLDNGIIEGSLFGGTLPPAPDVVKEKVAFFEVTGDGRLTKMRGVFRKFPAGSSLVIYKDGKVMTEVKLFFPVTN